MAIFDLFSKKINSDLEKLISGGGDCGLELRKWVKNEKIKSPAEAWLRCQDSVWLVWMLHNAGKVTKNLAIEIQVRSVEHVLPLFESTYSLDKRPRAALEAASSWLQDPTEQNRSASEHAVNEALAAAQVAKLDALKWMAVDGDSANRNKNASEAAENVALAASIAAWAAAFADDVGIPSGQTVDRCFNGAAIAVAFWESTPGSVGKGTKAGIAEKAWQCELLREIFGNPFDSFSLENRL